MWIIVYFTPLLPFVAGWLLLLVTEQFFALSLVNGVAQLVLFAFVVCLPTWRTGRMSYVDIGWPWVSLLSEFSLGYMVKVIA